MHVGVPLFKIHKFLSVTILSKIMPLLSVFPQPQFVLWLLKSPIRIYGLGSWSIKSHIISLKLWVPEMYTLHIVMSHVAVCLFLLQ